MANLTEELVKQFARITNDNTSKQKNTTAYGVVKKDGEATFVQLDGSSALTPVFLSMGAEDGDRVVVEIKNHSALITGNLTNPAPSFGQSEKKYEDVYLNSLQAIDAKILNLGVDDLTAEVAKITEAYVDKAAIGSLVAEYGYINKLEVNELLAGYATIDLANITTASVKDLFVNVGMLEEATIVDGHITGTLSGVHINADVIEVNNIIAGNMVVLGDDGQYYKIHPEDYSSEQLSEMQYQKFVHGNDIIANSITANKLNVANIFGNNAVLTKIVSSDIVTNAITTGSLTIAASAVEERLEKIKMGGANLIRNSTTLKKDDYRFIEGAAIAGAAIVGSSFVI